MAVQIKKSGQQVRTCCPDSGLVQTILDWSRAHFPAYVDAHGTTWERPNGLIPLLVCKCAYKRIFFVVLFRKGPNFLLPLYVCSRGTDEIWISQTERKLKLIPVYMGKVSCREFWQPFLRNRSRWCPDGVQIWSRFGSDFAVQTVWSNFGNHPVHYHWYCFAFCSPPFLLSSWPVQPTENIPLFAAASSFVGPFFVRVLAQNKEPNTPQK